MYASTLLLAVPVIIGRFFIVQSPLWLMFRGRVKEAETALPNGFFSAIPYIRKKSFFIAHELATSTRSSSGRRQHKGSAMTESGAHCGAIFLRG